MKNNNQKQFVLGLKYDFAMPIGRALVQQYAKKIGTNVGLVYIGGYPKSGTTWISKMVAYYLELPWVGHTDFAFGFPSVIHHHWNYDLAFDQSIFVIRDGRDVIVSTYMSVIKGYTPTEKALDELGQYAPSVLLRKNFGRYATLRKRLRHLYGLNFDPHDVTSNLPKFIEAEMKKPFVPEVKLCWPRYISEWKQNSQNTVYVKYEDMLQNSQTCLNNTLVQFLSSSPVEEDVSYITNRFSFERLTGRKQGKEDRGSFARKGIAGDWKNYFSEEACQVFDHYAGNILIELGYETNHDWRR
jgi:hypothetical protein